MSGHGERAVLGAFIASALFAGGNGVAIRFSNRELAPLWGAGLRFVLATILLIPLMAALHVAFPRRQSLRGAVLWGLFQFSGAFGLYYYALVHLHAGLGQTILALVPLAALLLAVVQRQEPLHRAAVVGTLLGVAGVAVIVRNPLQDSVPLSALAAVLGSVLCFAEANVLARRLPSIHPVAMNAAGMLCGAAVLVVASAAAGEPHVLPRDLSTWVALGYVSALGSVAVFLLIVFVLHHWTASRAAYVMVLIPFVTVLISAWLDSEPVGAGLLLGGLLVLMGVYMGALRPARVSAPPSH